jgi:site-specific DNA-methyltransferase (adenine-specific)
MSVEWVNIGPHRLACGDCLEILPTLAGVDAVVTDPPYGINLGKTSGTGGAHGLNLDAYESYEDTYENFVAEIVPRLNASLDAAKRSAVFSGPHIHEQRKPDAIGGVHCSAGSGRHRWGFKTFLPVLFYGTAPALNLGAKPIMLSSNETTQKNGHPCPKPIGWMKWLVGLASLGGETVLDPFMGSGTTGVACQSLGRVFIGIDREPKYFDIACRRIEEAMKAEPLLEGVA